MKARRCYSTNDACLNQDTTHPKRSGFTLIELLVVVAIIAILAAILFPVFATAREKARMTACASNLKQIGVAVMMYSQDYDETMPLWAQNSSFNSGKYINWLLDPYIKVQDSTNDKKAIWRCPSTDRTSVQESYGYNYTRLGNFTTLTGFYANYQKPAKLASLQAPAQTICFADGNGVLRTAYAAKNFAVDQSIRAWHQTTDPAGGLDPDGWINVLWCDGHVKAIKRKLVVSKTGTTPATYGEACSDDLWDRYKPSPWRIGTCPSTL